MLKPPPSPCFSSFSICWEIASIEFFRSETFLPRSTAVFYLTSLLILPQVSPNLRVLIVSRFISELSATQTIRCVMQLPLRESFISIVKALSLQGIKPSFDLLSWSMVLPRALRLVLMFLASSALIWVTPDLFILSLPARSTKVNLDD